MTDERVLDWHLWNFIFTLMSKRRILINVTLTSLKWCLMELLLIYFLHQNLQFKNVFLLSRCRLPKINPQKE